MKILICEDDVTDRALLRAALGPLGFDIEVTVNGEQAWQALQRPEAARLVILDWVMPRLSGLELCRKIRARNDDDYTYVILLTGKNSLDDMVEGMNAGADDYVTKPFKPAELGARLRAGQRILDLQQRLLAAQNQLKERATRDGLTGLLNHVTIMERLHTERERCHRERRPLGVIMIDLDHFKQINDAYGHRGGDQVLEAIAGRIHGALRPYDSLGRYGGEEFLVVLPGCDQADTLRIANRILVDTSAGPIDVGVCQLSVTLSAGTASEFPGSGGDVEQLIGRADRALYQAKRLGRNRVETL